MAIASIIVNNLSTNDPWADTVRVRMYLDSAYTEFASYQDSTLAGVQSNGLKYQFTPLVFDNLTVGQTYYFSVTTLIAGYTQESLPTRYAALAGDPTMPAVSYTYTAVATQNGLQYTITPSGAPADIDHYEWYIDYANLPSSYINNYNIQTATGYTGLNSNGQFTFYVGSGGGTVAVYVRAVNTTGIGQEWTNVDSTISATQQKYTVCSVGEYATPTYGIPYIALNDSKLSFQFGGSTATAFSGINVVGINKSTYTIDWFSAHDVSNGTQSIAQNAAASLLNAINALSNHVIVLFGYINPTGLYGPYPSSIRANTALMSALYGIGMSGGGIGSYSVQNCCAYILVGQQGLGKGNGLECYSGAINLDPNAFAITSFYLSNGQVVGWGNQGVNIDPGTGGVAATGGLPPSLSNSFTYTNGYTNIDYAWSDLTVFRADNTTSTYNGSSNATGLSGNTTYSFYPMICDDPTSAIYDLVYFVNQISGGVGVFNNAYPSFNYSALQYASSFQNICLAPAGITAATTSSSGTTGGGSVGGSGTCMHGKTWVEERTKGWIHMMYLEEGDYIDSPNGWVRVKSVSFSEEDLWVGITFGDIDVGEYLCTTNHEWPLFEGGTVQAAKLGLNDLLPTKNGVVAPSAIRLVRAKNKKVLLEVDHPSHLFYVGFVKIATHNISKLSC